MQNISHLLGEVKGSREGEKGSVIITKMLILGLVEVPWWLLLIICFVLYILYISRDYGYFKKHGIPYAQPLVPGMGNLMSLMKKGMVDYNMDLLKQFGGNSVVGQVLFGPLSLIAFDAEFLSQMMVKEFHNFQNRMNFDTGSQVSKNMLTGLEDQHWKHVRNGMTPTFTTGKLKNMAVEINRCGQGLVKHMQQAVEQGGEIDAKEYTGGYTMDVIASTAFGMRVNSQEEPNNVFVQNAKEAFDLRLESPRILIPVFFPTLSKLLVTLGFSYEIFGEGPVRFFSGITKQTIDMRSESLENDNRTDFIQLMLKAQKGENIKEKDDQIDEDDQPDNRNNSGLSTDEIIANAMLFFVAGYDTTASSLRFFLYNMAKYPEVQEKLVEEIESVIGDASSIDYNKLVDMPYLDQCVNENLRIYPPAVSVNRVASQDVTINGIQVKKGMVIDIPIYCIHHDPKKWPEPDIFDPERFTPENKKDRNPYFFIPFGNGPRNCIGMRLALIEMKIAIVYMLRGFKISTCEKTPAKFTWLNKGLLSPNEPVVVKISART